MVDKVFELDPPPPKYLYQYRLGEKDIPTVRTVAIAHETKTFLYIDGEINWKRRLDKRYQSHFRGWYRTEKEALNALVKSMQEQVESSRKRVKSCQAILKSDRQVLANVRKYRSNKK